jgi:hypothetical protein
MLGEYKVSRCTRQCHALGRPLREGEWYYSVVIQAGAETIRRDYSAEAWQGAPEGTIGWWKSRMPTAEQRKRVLAPPAVLIDLLRQMADFPEKAKSRYLLALMLMRKKILRPADASDRSGRSQPPADVLHLEVATGAVDDREPIEVPVCPISRGESDRLREELNELLYCDASQEMEPDTDD